MPSFGNAYELLPYGDSDLLSLTAPVAWGPLLSEVEAPSSKYCLREYERTLLF